MPPSSAKKGGQDLFSRAHQEQIAREAPLAARMRPRTLDEFVGQDHILGPGRLLRRAIQADQLSSVIFYGPPGTGKTTLAMVIANTTRSRFVTLNAVLAGVADIREVTGEAQEQRKLYGRRTILFVDEVHRWNKAQQDALLPWVENGAILMIGATTENPWFSVNRPLVSRSRVFQLLPLKEEDLATVARHALADPEHGYGKLRVDLQADALAHLVDVSNGDARSLLNALELAVETTPPNAEGVIAVDMSVAEESIQRRAVLYDREGDYHFDTISAFIKSLRGSDPDAALYWLAKMVYAGEDPRFIFRRMLILACEDVGLADPQAIRVVEADAAAFDRIGLPEGQFHLTHAALYLATAPKSNSALAYFDALKVVQEERDSEVPTPLKDASRDKEGFGHGQGYLYPHAYRDHWVAQQYLPAALQGRVFYHPSDQGYERQLGDQVARRREEQLAAMVEGIQAPGEVLTFTSGDRERERWLLRTISDVGARLGELRDKVLGATPILRHHLILDINAGTGLLTWEALRRVPEGGVWALARDARSAEALRQQAAALQELERPTVIEGDLRDLPRLLAQPSGRELRFDAIVGRNALTQCPHRATAARLLAGLLATGGSISLAEGVPRRTQRIYQLAEWAALDTSLFEAWRDAEEAIYADPGDPMTNWDALELEGAFREAGLAELHLRLEPTTVEIPVTGEQVGRWWGAIAPTPGAVARSRPAYAQQLARRLAPEQLAAVRDVLERQLVGKTCQWRGAVAYLVAHS